MKKTMILICFISFVALLKINLFCEVEIRTYKSMVSSKIERGQKKKVLICMKFCFSCNDDHVIGSISFSRWW